MDQVSYLYGASVQGIQRFIFQTNELKDIIGASELVQKICTDFFEEFECSDPQQGEPVIQAAGNIKYIFHNEQDCRRAVLEFPKKVMMAAPGITISQAVVPIPDMDKYDDAAEELEAKLRAQRNKPFNSITTGLMGIERSRKTGLPAVEYVAKDKEYIDLSTQKKKNESKTRKLCELSFGIDGLKDRVLPYDISEMTGKNDWIAVIHADGNSLGEMVAQIGKDWRKLRQFSKDLEDSTIAAAQKAYEAVIKHDEYENKKEVIPFRPIVLSGDDMTMICRADLAMEYTKQFIAHFEEETKKRKCPLTACAGIAFIKSSYPFYYGYELAENLCAEAKKDAKQRKTGGKIPSCLMFYKVQSSFVEDYQTMVEKELTPGKGLSFVFGPYYLKEEPERWTIDKLLHEAKHLNGKDLNEKDGNIVKSRIRHWMTLMHDDRGKAKQYEQRSEEILKDLKNEDILNIFVKTTKGEKRNSTSHYPAYDLLAIHTINQQQTND